MVLKKTGVSPAAALFFLYMLLFIVSCGTREKHPDVSAIPVTIKTLRFEADLMSYGTATAAVLRQKYPDFFDLYFFQVVRIGSPDSILMQSRIADFVSDPDIQSIYLDTKSKYPDFSDVDRKLTDAFRYYHYYFPEKIIPNTVTFISGFNNAIVCADSLLGVGLDMYLGKESKYYHALKFPVYKIEKMSGEYIAADALKGWIQSEWPEPETNADLLSHMIYEGKILLALKKLMPEEPDTLLTGYSMNQLEWCRRNEKNIWSFFIDNKLLFAMEQNQILKFITDGPTTGGFPKESPGNIGQWIGYRIVVAYFNAKKETNLDSLMNEKDYKMILHESRYKPGQ